MQGDVVGVSKMVRRAGAGTVRKAVAASIVIAMVGLSTACNSSAGAPAESESSSEPGGTSGDGTAYPLTLETPYGSTELAAEPERVAIAGQVGDTENVLSLGVIPVLAPEFQLQWPWIDEHDRSEIESTYAGDATSELPMEQFAAAEPDVIIATTDTQLEQHYEQLSQIAPVVAFPDKESTTQFDWERSITLIAEALNRSDEAKEQISATKEKLAAVPEEHPEFVDTSISFSIDYGGDSPITFYNGAGSPGEELLTGMGFAPADNADKFSGERPEVSGELLPMLESDIVVINFNGGKAGQEKLESNRVFAAIPAVKEGRYVPLLPQGDSSPLAWSLARPTAANLQWSIDYLVPELVPAAQKVN